MSDSTRLSAYSEVLKNFEIISNLPPKNIDIADFTGNQLDLFRKINSDFFYLKPIIKGNKIEHYEIDRNILSRSVITYGAKEVFRNKYLRNNISHQEHAAYLVINIIIFLLCFVFCFSDLANSIFQSKKMIYSFSMLIYLYASLFFSIYYFFKNIYVLKSEVVDDIYLGLIEINPELIRTHLKSPA